MPVSRSPTPSRRGSALSDGGDEGRGFSWGYSSRVDCSGCGLQPMALSEARTNGSYQLVVD